ncbi:MAG: DUF3052 domain-containing protein [Angustibacter sp.]
MSATADAAADRGFISRLGLHQGQVVQELGWDDDADDGVRQAIEGAVAGELLDEESDEVADIVVLWWREDEGDLVDALVDALTNLADGGAVLLLTPKAGRDGHVQASDVAEAALAAGLHSTSTVAAGSDWSATRLVAPRSGRK